MSLDLRLPRRSPWPPRTRSRRALNDVADVDIDRTNGLRDREPTARHSAPPVRSDLRRTAGIAAGVAAVAAVPARGRRPRGDRAVPGGGLLLLRRPGAPLASMDARAGRPHHRLRGAALLVWGSSSRTARWGGVDVGLLLGLCVLFFARIILKDIRDRLGDAAHGKPTALLRLGKSATCAVSIVGAVAGTAILVRRSPAPGRVARARRRRDRDRVDARAPAEDRGPGPRAGGDRHRGSRRQRHADHDASRGCCCSARTRTTSQVVDVRAHPRGRVRRERVPRRSRCTRSASGSPTRPEGAFQPDRSSRVMCRWPDVLAEVRKRVRGRVGGGPRFLREAWTPDGRADARRVPDAGVEHARQRAIMSSVQRREPLVGHRAELCVAVTRGQRRSHRQAEPRQGRAERMRDDHRDRVRVAAGGRERSAAPR